MPRVFNRIRKQLAKENKFFQYSRYAIGEILLVVIGILIALQVDSWNEERKERIEEQILLRQLKDDYTNNLEQLDNKIETRKVLINSSKDLLTFFDNPSAANKDSVMSKFGNLGMLLTYDPIDNDLVASGRINIIQSQKLKTLLTKWSTDVIQVQEVEALYANSHTYEYVPALNKIGIGRAMDKALYERIGIQSNFLLNSQEYIPYDFGESRLGPSLEGILNNVELEGIVANSILVNEVINAESYTLRKQILEILDLLEELSTPEN